MKSKISVIILTYNEKLHIRRCIENIKPMASEIFVVDCHSTDGTQAIATELGATVVERDWPGLYAVQLNWAIDNLPITGDWVLRLDADEYLTDALHQEIVKRLDTLEEDVSGVTFALDHIFLKKKLRFGNPKVRLLRLWRKDKAHCEKRKMDEHMAITEGRIVDFEGAFVDHNLNNLIWWTQKHLGYAQREKADLLESAFDNTNLSSQAAKKRRMKSRYARLPLFWRSFAYFCYRYFFKLGFLDGKPGFIWAILQAFWYRTFVDALIYEDEINQKDK